MQDRTRSRQKHQQKSASQNETSIRSSQSASNPLLNRKSLETPKQKFQRLLAEGHKAKKKKYGDSDAGANSELEIISPEGTVEIDWESHPEARSGCFIATVANKEHHIDAKLEDEADNRIYSFGAQAQVKTHVLPLGEAGDTAYFDVVNSSNGETAVAKATTYSITGSIGGWIKNLFS